MVIDTYKHRIKPFFLGIGGNPTARQINAFLFGKNVPFWKTGELKDLPTKYGSLKTLSDILRAYFGIIDFEKHLNSEQIENDTATALKKKTSYQNAGELMGVAYFGAVSSAALIGFGPGAIIKLLRESLLGYTVPVAFLGVAAFLRQKKTKLAEEKAGVSISKYLKYPDTVAARNILTVIDLIFKSQPRIFQRLSDGTIKKTDENFYLADYALLALFHPNRREAVFLQGHAPIGEILFSYTEIKNILKKNGISPGPTLGVRLANIDRLRLPKRNIPQRRWASTHPEHEIQRTLLSNTRQIYNFLEKQIEKPLSQARLSLAGALLVVLENPFLWKSHLMKKIPLRDKERLEKLLEDEFAKNGKSRPTNQDSLSSPTKSFLRGTNTPLTNWLKNV